MTRVYATPCGDAELLAEIVSHPSIREYVRDEKTDLDDIEIVESELLMGAYTVKIEVINKDSRDLGGCFIFSRVNTHLYELHTCLLENCRKELATEAFYLAALLLFANTSCMRLITKVPDWNEAAYGFAERIGFRHQYSRDNIGTYKGKPYEMDFFSMGIADFPWAYHSKLEKVGDFIHERIHNKNKELGIEVHEDDPAHDAALGFCIALCESSMDEIGPTKAIEFYNEWAVTSGYFPAQLLRNDTVAIIIDIGNDLALWYSGRDWKVR